MSNLKVLEKLRNPKIYIPHKSRFNIQSVDTKLNQIKNYAEGINNEALIMPESLLSKIQQQPQDLTFHTCSRYIGSNQILTARQTKSKNRLPLNHKNHKRGGSVESKKSNDLQQIAQSPISSFASFALRNFTLKFINTPDSQKQTRKNIPKSNPVSQRKQIMPQSHLSQFHPTLIRKNKNRVYSIQKSRCQDHFMVGKKSFQIICPVGKGGFGKVWKVKCKRTGEILAMKQMQKGKIITKKSVKSVVNQRVLLAELHHPFLINMKSAFQDRQNLYLVMDYVNGGDLRYHIGKRGKFSQNQTKFFISNIIICLQYLHAHKVIHRDLKPENLVFDSNGFLYTTDLGVSRIVKDDNSFDTSGTPGYMAPEVLCGKNHSYPVDYFAVGVIAYELMLGHRPYQGRNRKQIISSIELKQAEVKIDQIPYKWSVRAADFINKLLQRSPQKRLGANGISQLKDHPWLVDVDWKALQSKSVRPPFIPISIQENYSDYKQQISEDSIDDNLLQTKEILKDQKTQSLFKEYDFESKANKRKLSLMREKNYIVEDHIPISFQRSLRLN